MLDYQMVMLAREISQERVQGLSLPTSQNQGSGAFNDFWHGSRRKLTAFLAQSVNKPVNLVIGQRYQNRHRLREGTT